MIASFDPHHELGVAGHASEREIRSAYRRLAAQWHPDRNAAPGAAERMARINQAYRHLCGNGPSPRAEAAPPPARPAEAASKPPRPSRSWWERDWSKSRWEPDGALAPRDLAHEASIRLEDAAFGCRHRVTGSIADQCAACSGVGRMVSRRSDCRACRGVGRLRGAGGSEQACAACFGDGEERKPCEDCKGGGKLPKPRRYEFEVRIPAGMREGQIVVLRGQGQRGAAGAGNIDVTIRIQPHPIFSFDAQQRLSCELPVDIFSQLGGARIEIPNLDGKTTPVDLSLGAEQLIEGQGFPKRDGRRGPLVVKTRSVMPSGFNASQSKLLLQLAEELRREGYSQSAELAAWQQQVDSWRRQAEPPASAS